MGAYELVLFLLLLPCAGAVARSLWRRPSDSSVGSRKHLYFYTALGLLIGFGLLAYPLVSVIRSIYSSFNLPWLTTIGLGDATLKVITVGAMLFLVLKGEKRPLSSIGIVKPRLSDIGWGVLAFAIGEVLTIATAFLLPNSFSVAAETRHLMFARFPFWVMMLIALVNGIFEEMIARGFAVERLREVTHSSAAGALIALAINDAAHIPYWGWRASLILIPGLGTFVVLYLWRRSIVPCAIGHILNDAAPALLALFFSMPPTALVPYLSYHQQGAIYYRKGDFDRSISLYCSAIARNPRDFAAYSWRGLAYLNKKDDAKAFADLSEAIRVNPKSAEPYRHRAFAYLSRNDYAHARADVEHALEVDSRDPGSWELRGRLDLHDGRPARVADDYSHAIRLDPTNVQLYQRRAQAEAAAGDNGVAIRDYQRIIRFNPSDASGWIDLSQAYESDGDYEEALNAIEHVLSIDPIKGYARRAQIYQYGKELDLAMADINQASKLDPKDPNLYVTRAGIRIELSEDLDGALADYNIALQLTPERYDLYVSRALVYAAKKDDAAAIADYSHAILLEPQDPSLYQERARVFRRIHDYKKMNSDWQKALEIDPDNSDTYNNIAWNLATTPNPEVRDGKRALALARKSCDLSDWKDSDAIDTIAAAYAEVGDFKSAVEFENKALALEESDQAAEKRARLKLYEDHQPYRDTSN